MEKYEVIIIGAGPSGLAAAISLYDGGIKNILVVERCTFPRYKCCAGYVTAKTGKVYKRLGLDIADLHYSLINDFNILYRHKRRLNIENKFLYTNEKIDRVELDDGFFRLAKSRGIEIAEGVKIHSHDREAGTLTLSDGRNIRYGSIIFADGTVGFGSRYQRTKRKNIAMQLTFADERRQSIEIHFGITKRGYGWVSSYNGITNVGLTDVYDKNKNYKSIFSAYMKSLGITADEGALCGAFTPIGTGKAVIGGNMYFVGDAVGACDPLTLSGLRYGLASGISCAQSIIKGRKGIYKRFVRGLKFRFSFMKAMQRVFYFRPVTALVFNVGCRCFGGLISRVFNNFFVNKK